MCNVNMCVLVTAWKAEGNLTRRNEKEQVLQWGSYYLRWDGAGRAHFGCYTQIWGFRTFSNAKNNWNQHLNVGFYLVKIWNRLVTYSVRKGTQLHLRKSCAGWLRVTWMTTSTGECHGHWTVWGIVLSPWQPMIGSWESRKLALPWMPLLFFSFFFLNYLLVYIILCLLQMH